MLATYVGKTLLRVQPPRGIYPGAACEVTVTSLGLDGAISIEYANELGVTRVEAYSAFGVSLKGSSTFLVRKP